MQRSDQKYETMGSQRKKDISIFRKVTLLCSILLIFFLSFEVGFRLFAPFPYYGYEAIGAFPDQYDENMGWSGIPNMNAYFTLNEFKTLVKTNEDGFRDASFDKKLRDAENKTTIMFIGDSFTWGWGVEKEDRLTEQLTSIDPNITTFNLGQSGYGIDQEFLLFNKFCKELKPQVVILMVNETDFIDTISAVRHDQNKPLFIIEGERLSLTNVPVPFDREYWEKKTAMAKVYGSQGFQRYGDPIEKPNITQACRNKLQSTLAKSHFFNWVAFRLLHPVWRHGKRESNILNNGAIDKSIIFRLFEEFQSNCRSIDSKFAVLLIPDKAQVITSQNKSNWQEEIISFCNEKNIHCLDLRPFFKGKKNTYFRLDPHWSARGHRLAAEAIYNFIQGLS